MTRGTDDPVTMGAATTPRARIVFEAEITPGMVPGEFIDLARLTEQAGFDRLGVSDVVLWPDAYMLQALAAQATRQILIGSVVANPYTRHPVVHAAAVATLQELSGGRAFLGLGAGAGLEDIGVAPDRPLRTLREAVTVITSLLAGETVEHRGEVLTLAGARLMVPPASRVPVAIGTRSPRIARLAGEVADFALIGARFFTADLASRYRGWVTDGASRIGRSPDDVQIAPRVTLCVSEDGSLARSAVKRYAAHYLEILGDDVPGVSPSRREAIRGALRRSTGWYFDHHRHDDPELEHLVDDELVAASAIAGTPGECAGRVLALLALGFTAVSCNLVAVQRPGNTMADGLRETLEGAAQVVASFR